MSDIENRLISLETKFDMFLGEMRDRDNQRAAEIVEVRQKHDADMKEIRADMKAMAQKHDADMKAMAQKHDAEMQAMRADTRDTIKHIQGLTIASMVGIAAIAVGVLAFIWSNINHNNQPAPQPPAQNQSVNFAGKSLYAAKIQLKECDCNVS